jgi:uncharacterized membrane protein
MNLAIDPYGAYGRSGVVRDVCALIDRDGEPARSIEVPGPRALMGSMRVGSAGVVVLVSGYAPYLPHVGTSPAVFDSRGVVRSSTVPVPEAPGEAMRTTTRQAVLRMSSADQAREVMAALNLNTTQLADVLRASRPTLDDWLDGKELNVAIAQRLTRLVQLLKNAGVTAADSISPRFVRESLGDGEPSLLDLLKADTLDEVRLATVLARAKELEAEAERTRVAREDRLRKLGFEEPTAEQRKENLALNVALREWPKD